MKNILQVFFTVAFILGTVAMNAQTKIYVHKSNGTADEYNIADIDSISFTSPATTVDYSKLKLNEVSGVGGDPDKFYELINIGDVEIPLEGCTIDYNANGSDGGVFPPNGNQGITWIGCASHSIAPGEFFMIQDRNSSHVIDINSCVTVMRTGLTAGRILIITLKDPAGNVIDQCIRALDTGDDYAFGDKSFSRIPDGTGPFYFTTPTPDATNGTSTAGLTLVPETQHPVDYTKLILNEISGEHKFVEIYNSGTVEIPLEGVKLQRNGGPATSGSEWVGTAADAIPAGEYRLFLFNSNTASLEENPAFVGWRVGSGISDQQILKVAIVNPQGTEISVFIRGDEPLPAWGTSVSGRERDYSYSLMTDSTWANAEPTPGAANGEKVKDIVNPGYLTAQP